jgi:hypothetical protein
MNSDVTVYFIDVLPRIKPGVTMHIHDILLPWDYPESSKSWYWNEQYMLAVYMMASKATLCPMLPTHGSRNLPNFPTFSNILSSTWALRKRMNIGGTAARCGLRRR